MGSITLRGLLVVFDDADAAIVCAHRWWLTPQGYAATSVRWPDGSRRTICMHRLLLGDPQTQAIDHLNRDRRDNRRANLRACSDSTNNKNRPTALGKTSQFRGVSLNKRGKWQVVVRIDGRLTWLGQYDDEPRAGEIAAPYFHGVAP